MIEFIWDVFLVFCVLHTLLFFYWQHKFKQNIESDFEKMKNYEPKSEQWKEMKHLVDLAGRLLEWEDIREELNIEWKHWKDDAEILRLLANQKFK